MTPLELFFIGIIIFVVGFGIWVKFFYLERKKREEVLNDFEKAEKMFANSKGEKTPYQILYEIARENYFKEIKSIDERRKMEDGQARTKAGESARTEDRIDTGADNSNSQREYHFERVGGDEKPRDLQAEKPSVKAKKHRGRPPKKPNIEGRFQPVKPTDI